MKDMARTIDNLGVDISTRYAEDRELFDESFIKEALRIPEQTRITVTLPSYAQEFDLLFDLGKRRVSWAQFIPPANYYAYRGRLFSDLIIPKLGSPNQQEVKMERIEALGDEEKRKKHDQKAPPEEEEEVEIEKQALLNLLKNIHLFDQLLIDINSRRAQYQKG